MDATLQAKTGKRRETSGTSHLVSIDLAHLAVLSDAGLLRLLLAVVETTHPTDKPAYLLASLLGVDRKTIQNIENGRARFNVDELQTLALEYPLVRAWISAKFTTKGTAI